MAARLAPNDVRRNAKHRWIIERDYEELKQELGLGHYEERGWRGFTITPHCVSPLMRPFCGSPPG
jgi:SRSO17 transposase